MKKFTSRKFLVAIIATLEIILLLFNVDALTVERVIALACANAPLVAYILGESYVDGQNIKPISREELDEYTKIDK